LVVEVYRSNSAKKDLMLSVSVCAHHSQQDGGSAFEIIILIHNKCNLRSHFEHIKRSLARASPLSTGPKTLPITPVLKMCGKWSQFLCVNEQSRGRQFGLYIELLIAVQCG